MSVLRVSCRKTKDLWNQLSDQTANHRLFDELGAAGPVEISDCLTRALPPNYQLLRVDGRLSQDELEIALIETSTKAVVYYNRVEFIGELGGRPVVQCLPWRTHVYLDSPIPSGLHGDILMSHLLDRYTVLLSDSELTASGEHFWQSQISRALHEKLSVYFWMADTGKLKQLTDTAQIEELKLLRSDEPGDIDQRLVVISKIALSTDIKVQVEESV